MTFILLSAVTTQEALASAASFAGLIWVLGIFIAILYALFPLIVMLQLGELLIRTKKLHQRLDATDKTGTLFSVDLHKEIGNSRNIQEFLLAETKTQNQLTRQLLRAYGHEPEV